MDLGARGHYVPRAMELLLILSAMLSAVTGAFTGARAPEPRLHHPAAQIVAVAEPRAETAVVVRRSESELPGIALLAALAEAPGFAIAAPAPLFAVRLNE